MPSHRFVALHLLALGSAIASRPALADSAAPPAPSPSTFGAPVAIGDGFSFDPMLDGRLRWEDVQLPARALSADAVTLRLRAGFELAHAPSHLSFLAEAEGNLALDSQYDAYPYALPANVQYRPRYAVVPDAQNAVLNRLQVAYRSQMLSLTVGRQRINLDDERWVGSVNWRQNEQTFDAARATARLGPLALDVTFADSQHTVFGADAGPRVAYDGRFWFLGAAVKTGPVVTKGFAYLLDYDPTAFGFQTNSSQTYGFRSAARLPLAPHVSLDLMGSYAHQSNYKDNPIRYAADYVYGEGKLGIYDLTLGGGYEDLGSDPTATGGAYAVQTPMATFHKWDGWADQFLTTPAKGLVRKFASVSYRFSQISAIPGLNAQVIYHDFSSDIGGIAYGHEWDEAVGLRTGPVNWLIGYADFVAHATGTNTRKFWLQAEFGF